LNIAMADQHPYRNDPGTDPDTEDEVEDQVVFEKTGRVPNGQEDLFPSENTYYLPAGGDPDKVPCGILCLRFPSLGRYATLNMFIVILTVLCCFQGALIFFSDLFILF
jgi:hypothetical protein